MLVMTLFAAARADDAWQTEARADFVMGFVGGQRNPAAAPFAQDEGPASASVTEAFLSGVPSGTTAFGPSWEARMVIQHVRFDLGVAAWWPDWPADAAAGPVHGLRGQELIFGLGVEPPIGPVTPFVDLLGRATAWQADLPVGDDETRWSADGFDPAVRLGLLGVIDDHLLVEAAGTVLPLDPSVWDVSIRAGFAFY